MVWNIGEKSNISRNVRAGMERRKYVSCCTSNKREEGLFVTFFGFFDFIIVVVA